jgi:hypothetical protein
MRVNTLDVGGCDDRTCIASCHHRSVRCGRMGDGDVMIDFRKWFRYLWYDLEDLLDDLLRKLENRFVSKSTRATPLARPKSETRGDFAFCSVSFNRSENDIAGLDAEFTANVMRHIAEHQLFELREY